MYHGSHISTNLREAQSYWKLGQVNVCFLSMVQAIMIVYTCSRWWAWLIKMGVAM